MSRRTIYWRNRIQLSKEPTQTAETILQMQNSGLSRVSEKYRHPMSLAKAARIANRLHAKKI